MSDREKYWAWFWNGSLIGVMSQTAIDECHRLGLDRSCYSIPMTVGIKKPRSVKSVLERHRRMRRRRSWSKYCDELTGFISRWLDSSRQSLTSSRSSS